MGLVNLALNTDFAVFVLMPLAAISVVATIRFAPEILDLIFS